MTTRPLDTMTAAEFEAYARERFGDDDLTVSDNGAMLCAWTGTNSPNSGWNWSEVADKLAAWYSAHPVLVCDCGKCHECHERKSEAAIDRVDGGE